MPEESALGAITKGITRASVTGFAVSACSHLTVFEHLRRDVRR